MARTSPSTATAPAALPGAAAAIAAGGAIYGQWLDLQVSWWTAWLDWQAGNLREFQRQSGELPPWMIWFNGTEQLA